MKYTIQKLTTYQELMQIHRLQQEIWGLNDPAFGLYPPLMNTAIKNGGIALGAFDAGSGGMVAFLFGFLGKEPGGPLKLCSQVMGVLPTWRKLGIAEALKQAQRRQVMEQGLPLITWTYDPLEGPNAHLNLHKLRAVSRTYWRDVYGSDFGKLNAGLPSDRLVVEWWVRGDWLEAEPAASADAAAPVFQVAGQGVDRRIVQANLELEADSLHLESVADIHPLKTANLDLALEWRLHIRMALETYFARGYLATDFVSSVDPETGERRNRYLLQKGTPALLAHIGIEA